MNLLRAFLDEFPAQCFEDASTNSDAFFNISFISFYLLDFYFLNLLL